MAIVAYFKNVGDKVQRGTCLDTDVNPGPTSATYPIGSELYATDSQKTYITYDGTHWTEKVTGGGSGASDPEDMDFSGLPLSDPHVAGKAFLDENAKITISNG